MQKLPVTFNVRASAKINLSLKLVGKRADNYHLLDSIFVPYEKLYDEISLTLADGEPQVKMSSNLAEMASEKNLCAMAAKAYFKAAAVCADCRIHLTKNIPVGAGLGGGSSDCAAVLKILNSHFQKLSESQLHELALSLGADVPFFLVNKISRVTGIGENISVIDTDIKLPILLLSPPFSVSTPWAFKNINPSIIKPNPSDLSSKLISALKNDDILTAAKYLHNDFESLLFEKFPAYEIWRRNLLALNALHVGISGSGSSFFALFENQKTLEKAQEQFFEKGCVIKDD